jgi:hypothetical protein
LLMDAMFSTWCAGRINLDIHSHGGVVWESWSYQEPAARDQPFHSSSTAMKHSRLRQTVLLPFQLRSNKLYQRSTCNWHVPVNHVGFLRLKTWKGFSSQY